MSTYINQQTGVNLRLEHLDAPPYLHDFLTHELIVRNLSQNTVRSYYQQIRSFLLWLKSVDGNCEPTQTINDIPLQTIISVTAADVSNYLAYCTGTLNNTPKTRGQKLTAIKEFFRYLNEDAGQIKINPAASIKTPKLDKPLPKFLSLPECELLLNAVDGKDIERDYCIITLFLNCGMRLSELTGINVSDIRGETLKLYGKGRKERVIYLNASCHMALQDYLSARCAYVKEATEQALFISRRSGRRLTGRRIEQIVSQVLSRAGLSNQGYSPHKLRHTAATLLYESSAADVLVLQKLLGHANVATTAIYTHLSDEQMKEALKASPLSRFEKE